MRGKTEARQCEGALRGKDFRSGPGGEIGEAPPVADAARRFRGSAPIGGRDSGRESGHNGGQENPAPTDSLVAGTAGRCRHRPLRNRIMGWGSAPPAGDCKGRPYGGLRGVREKNPPVTASPCPFRQGGRGDGGNGLPQPVTSVTGFAMTGIFARGTRDADCHGRGAPSQ